MLIVNKIKYKHEKLSFEFNFELSNSEVVGIVGKSGSGKSTLINILAGFLKPHSGFIFFNTENITNFKPFNRDMTTLFQDHNNFNHLSIFENVILGIDPNMKKTSDNIKLVKTILKKVSLNSDLNKKVSYLSGGEQQRVSIARCLLRKKSILLLDEPFNALDPGLRKAIYKDIKKVSIDNKFITLICSHLIEELRTITDKFLYIDKGKIVDNKILSFNELQKNKSFKEYLK